MSMDERGPVAADEIDLRELFLTLWRRRWWIVGVTVASGLIALASSLDMLPPVYESRALIQISEHSAPAYATPHAAAIVLTSLSFLEPIARAQGIPEAGRRLERMVRAEPVRETRMLRLRIRYGDPARLDAFTDAVVSEFVRLGTQRVEERRRATSLRLEAVIAQIAEVEATLRLSRQTLARLQQSGPPDGTEGGFMRSFVLNTVGMAEGLVSGLLSAQRDLTVELLALEPPSLVQTPYIPPEPVSPRPLLNTTLAVVLGLMVGVVGALLAGSLKGLQAHPTGAQAPPPVRA